MCRGSSPTGETSEDKARACRAPDFRDSPKDSLLPDTHTQSLRRVDPKLKRTLVPTGTINNPFWTTKVVTIETTSKVSLKLISRINLGRQGARV